MQKRMGSRITDVRQHNRLLVLRHIATHPMISRADLAERRVFQDGCGKHGG